MTESTAFSSAAYWETRYRGGGDSGAGSAGALARYKAETVNRFIEANNIVSMIDMGCGDASQFALLVPPKDYVGVDVSPTILARCQSLHPEFRFVAPEELAKVAPAELTVSLDVIYHLVEEATFANVMGALFNRATRFVMIYSSNTDAAWPAAHVLHRRFTDYVAKTQPDWRLLAHLPNPRPYDPSRLNDTSFADFYIYGRPGDPCVIPIAAG
jgi:hypothetical protein